MGTPRFTNDGIKTSKASMTYLVLEGMVIFKLGGKNISIQNSSDTTIVILDSRNWSCGHFVITMVVTTLDIAGLKPYNFQNTKKFMLKFKCKDVGFECGFVAKGKTEDEILSQCATHATKDHGMKPEEITDDLRNQIKANIHKSLF